MLSKPVVSRSKRKLQSPLSYIGLSALLALSIAPQQSRADKIHDSDDPHGVVYVQTNDYRAGHNAVNAYRRDAAGCLQLLGSYATGGTGVFNFDDRIGPDDHAQEVIANRDHSLLFTVNGGSDDVSVFNINRDGSLTLAHGSPVNSNGIQPVSLGLSGTDLIVVNQDGDPNRPGLQTSSHPNYTEFRVVPNGGLVAIPNSTIELPQMSTPTQALVSPFGVYFFGDLLSGVPFPSGVGSIAPGLLPAAGSALQAFYKNPNQRFTQSPNSPMAPPPDAQAAPTIAQSRYTLGMDAHPYLPVVYVGYVVTNRLGVFTYDALGSLHFVKDVPLGTNDITVCWIKVSPDGRWVFTSNAGSNSIDVFDISGTVIKGSGPLSPMLVQSLPLKVPAGAPASEAQPVPGVFNYPTVSFQIETDPSGRFLYSVAHELVPNNDYPQGNVIHTVKVGQDGQLTEPSCSPVQVTNIPAGAHPQGVVAF